VDLYNANLTES